MSSLLTSRLNMVSKPNSQLFRLMSSQAGCGEEKKTNTCKMDVKKNPCTDAKPPSKKREPKKIIFKSMWDPSCFLPPCPNPPPLDAIHYKPSDKETRKYTRTWNECPPQKIVKKLLCEFPKFKVPPLHKRVKGQRPATAKSMKNECSGKNDNAKCIKISLPGCAKARNPPKCKVGRSLKDCEKIKCPYPAFSECNRAPPNPARRTECGCLLVRSLCEVYNRMRQLGQLK